MGFSHTTTLPSDHPVQNTLALAEKLQTRSSLFVGGWKLKFFACREDLLKNVASVSKAMLESRFFQRDLSESVVMRPMPLPLPASEIDIYNLVSRTTGKLIDLDHTKTTRHMKHVGNLAPSQGMVQRQTQDLISEDYYISVTEDAVKQALKFVSTGDLVNYCDAAIHFDVMKSDKEGNWTAKDLGWNAMGSQPDFDLRDQDNILLYMYKSPILFPKGTTPFASHQLTTVIPEEHNAIHDMESLFWVLIYICLVRESGGGYRRKDPIEKCQDSKTPEERTFTEEERKRIEQHNTLIAGLFYSPSWRFMGCKKGIHFDLGGSFKCLLEHVHEDFEPLKDLLRRWRNVLVLGHTFKAYEYYLVHRYILDIINDTLALEVGRV